VEVKEEDLLVVIEKVANIKYTEYIMNWWGFIYVNLGFLILFIFVFYIQFYREIKYCYNILATNPNSPNYAFCEKKIKLKLSEIIMTPIKMVTNNTEFMDNYIDKITDFIMKYYKMLHL